MRLALARTLSSIGTANPSTLLRMARVVSARADALVGAIRDGTLGLPIGELAAGDGGLARALCAVQARLRPAPDRARELETRLIRDGGVRLDRCWPDLALVGCWLGGNAGIQARRLGDGA